MKLGIREFLVDNEVLGINKGEMVLVDVETGDLLAYLDQGSYPGAWVDMSQVRKPTPDEVLDYLESESPYEGPDDMAADDTETYEPESDGM